MALHQQFKETNTRTILSLKHLLGGEPIRDTVNTLGLTLIVNATCMCMLPQCTTNAFLAFVRRAGDVLEFVNGVNLSNADHREAVRAVKETKRNLSIVR